MQDRSYILQKKTFVTGTNSNYPAQSIPTNSRRTGSSHKSRHSNYVATRIGPDANYINDTEVQYGYGKYTQGRSMPVAVSNYSIGSPREQGANHVGRSGSVPIGISKLTAVNSNQYFHPNNVPSHSSVPVAHSNHSIASQAGREHSYNSFTSIGNSPQYIGATNSVIHSAPSDHSLTTITLATDYPGPHGNLNNPLPLETRIQQRNQSQRSHSPSAPPVPPKPKRHSNSHSNTNKSHSNQNKNVPHSIPHSQSYSEAMLRKHQPLSLPVNGSIHEGSLHSADSVDMLDYNHYMPREGLPLGTCTLPMSSGTSLIVHESGGEDDLERDPPPPPPDVAQNDLMMRLGLLLGELNNILVGRVV